MQNRCCVNSCFFNNNSKAHVHWLLIKMILRNFISLRASTVYLETHCGFKFYFGQIDRSEDDPKTKDDLKTLRIM